ncbi:MAG: GcrA cell cycle regulator [Alphaproteobacteria bacterium]|nr:GcrA cell cycle regulator [Alphaproteobacteria bacterium]
MGWTDERVEQLKQMWTEGLSASQIARALGGVTRNAVIGKVHRLGLSGRASPTRPERPRIRSVAPRPLLPRPVLIEPVEVKAPLTTAEGGNITVANISRNQCKWPIGDPSDSDSFRFCGHGARAGSPYCEAHSRMAFQPMQSRRDRERRRNAS